MNADQKSTYLPPEPTMRLGDRRKLRTFQLPTHFPTNP